jgi:glycosyltransferase involved in cell wall biosynthesis
MKRVLIITYYWPPSGGAGVQRWLKFVKYLRDFGWEPVIYTPSNPESPINDESLEKDVPIGITVLKTEIWEPYLFYKRMMGQKKHEKINAAFLTESKKPKRFEKLAVWIRGNFFIPDARAFWIKPSAKYLVEYLKRNPVDAMISTGPPHSMHLIANAVKEKVNIPWMADFRDPWTEIDFYSKLMLTPMADNKHKKLELKVLRKADIVSCVGQNWLEGLETILKKSAPEKFTKEVQAKFKFISNGFDPDDYATVGEVQMDKKFTMAHIGTLDKSRNQPTLWKVLSKLVKENPSFAQDLEIKLVGKVDISVQDDIEKNGLTPYVNKIAYLSHHDVTAVQKQAQVLMLLVNRTPNAKGITTGKFFEYMAAKRPVLCIGIEGGDAEKIINETRAGLFAGFDDAVTMEKDILYFYNKYKEGYLPCESINIERYSRKSLTGDVANVLNSMVSNHK